jgi:hypothetical protein
MLSRDAQCFPKRALALVKSVATNKREACEAVEIGIPNMLAGLACHLQSVPRCR